MLSTEIQIYLGVLPALILTFFLCLLRRKEKMPLPHFLLMVALLGVGGHFLWQELRPQQEIVVTELKKEEILALGQALVLEQAYTQAETVLEDYASLFGYDEDCRLLGAQIEALSGNYSGAYQIFYSLDPNGAETKVLATQEESKLKQLSSQEENTSGLLLTQEEITKVIVSGMEPPSEEAKNLASFVVGDLQNPPNPDSLLYQISCLSEAKLIYDMSKHDFKTLAGDLSEESSFEEILVVTELLLNGLVEESDFPEEYRSIDPEQADLLKEKINLIVSREKEGLSSLEQGKLEATESYIKESLEDPLLTFLKTQLERATLGGEGKTERSKIFLEMAKIAYYQRNQEKMDKYLNEAIQSGQDSTDPVYSEAIEKLLSILYGKDEKALEHMKNTNLYVEILLDHGFLSSLKDSLNTALGKGESDSEFPPEPTPAPQPTPEPETKEESDGFFGSLFPLRPEEEEESLLPQSPEEESFSSPPEEQEPFEEPPLPEIFLSPEKEEETVPQWEDNPNSGTSDSSGNSGNTSTGDSTSNEDSTTVPPLMEDFTSSVVDYVNRSISAVTIGQIDTSAFDKLSVQLQIAVDEAMTMEELLDRVQIYDCGIEITEYTLEKVNYSQFNILLCCDVSGSMEDAIGDLRQAVSTFVAQQGQQENIGIITFSSGVQDHLPLGASQSDLFSMASSMKANGGTEIYKTTLYALEQFPQSNQEFNVLLVMTDGQDGSNASSTEMETVLTSLVEAYGVTIYTLGLGHDVNTSYLNQIALYGNGTYVHVAQPEDLEGIYEMLHGLFAQQYRLEYTARDTLTVKHRLLEVVIPEEGVGDRKTYSLEESLEENLEENSGESLKILQNLAVYGLDSPFVHAGSGAVTLRLAGSGFEREYVASMVLEGLQNYYVDLTFESEQFYRLVLPEDLPKGTYDLNITIDGRNTTLFEGLTIGESGNYTSRYGDYFFVSGEKQELGDNSYLLRGNVTMNDWLVFKGDVMVTGTEEGNVSVSTESGAYVQFDGDSATGLANLFARKGVTVSLPSFGDFTLYTENLLGEGRQLDNIFIDQLFLLNVFTFHGPVISLEPFQMSLKLSAGTSMFPMQDVFLSFCNESTEDFFGMESGLEYTGIMGRSVIGIQKELSYEDKRAEIYQQISLFNNPADLNMNQFDISIDTLAHEYKLDVVIDTKFLEPKVGLGLTWANDCVDSVRLYYDKEFKGQIGSVPVTYGAFFMEANNISAMIESKKLSSIELVGGLTIATGKISAYYPKLTPLVGDVSILEMPDTKFTFCLSPFHLGAEAELKFLKTVTLAEAQVEVGNFDYQVSLPGYNNLQIDEKVQGVEATLGAGFQWTYEDFCDVKFWGSGTASLHNRFIGATMTGEAKFVVGWWLLNYAIDIEGLTMFGFFFPPEEEGILILKAEYRSPSGVRDGIFYYIDQNGNTHLESGDLY